jgi:hypothetical protein
MPQPRAIALLALLLLVVPGWAQDALYTSLDRMYLRPHLPLPPVAPQATVKLSLYHTYPVALHHVRLLPQSPYLTVRQVPSDLSVLKPTTIDQVSLEMQVKERPPSDVVTLRLGLAADEIRAKSTYPLQIPLTEEAATRLQRASAVTVGNVEVRVRRYAGWSFLIYLIPTLILTGLLLWRKWHLR